MKLKSDFITNSSSTNFVIASDLRSANDIQFTLTINVKLSSLEGVQTISTKEELDAFIKEGYYEDDSSYMKPIIEAFMKGKTIHCFSASNDSCNPLENVLCEMGIKNDMLAFLVGWKSFMEKEDSNMKFKADFVTNSSTTSFIAYGASFHISDLNENSIVLQAMYQEYLKTKEDSNTHRTMVVKSGEESQDTPEKMEEWLSSIRDEDYTFFEWFESVCKPLGLDACLPPYDGNILVGISPFDMREDETYGQFKKRVEGAFRQLELPADNLHQMEEAWRDG